MSRNLLPCWRINVPTGLTDGDDYDGVSASADRVAKRRRKGSPINDAIGGAAGDEQHGVSDSIDGTANEHFPYTVEALDDHIKKFEHDPKILKELGCCVESNETEIMTEWFKELRAIWKGPVSSEEATKLVKRAMYKVHNNMVYLNDLEGFTLHYGLPSYLEIDLPPEDRIQYD